MRVGINCFGCSVSELTSVWVVYFSGGAYQGLLVGDVPNCLHVKRLGCQADVAFACIEEEVVRSVVLGSVVVESGWEKDMAVLLGGWHSSVPCVKGPEIMVGGEVDDLSVRLSSLINQDSPVVVTQMDADCLQNLIRCGAEVSGTTDLFP